MEHFIVLDEQRRDSRGRTWPLPIDNGDRSWSPGELMPPVSGRSLYAGIEDHSLGYSGLDEQGLLGHLGASIYEAESSDPAASCSAAPLRDNSQVRLLRAMNWDASVARSFACDCAEHVLPVVGILYPRTKLLHGLLDTSRAFVAGTASHSQLEEALRKAKKMPVVRLDRWASGPVCDGDNYIPLFEFACPAAAAVLATASEPAWRSATVVASKAREASMGDLTRDRIAVLKQAVKTWGGIDRTIYGGYCLEGRDESKDAFSEAYDREYGWILNDRDLWRREESVWQEDLLSRYLHGQVAPH